MTFISVIDSLNRLKGNISERRSKRRTFDNRTEYLNTYFGQKHIYGPIRQKKKTLQAKISLLKQIKSDSQKENKLIFRKSVFIFILSICLALAIIFGIYKIVNGYFMNS